jgi:hypothetical protein
MPQGIVPVSFLKPDSDTGVARQPHRPALVTLSTWLHRGALDAEIAQGVETAGDARLALRAEQLAARAERDRLATALERTLEIANRPPSNALGRSAARRFSVRVPLRVREIRDCADDVEALARRLRDGKAVDAQGAALTKRLLIDGASPLYYRHSSATLRHAVRSARLALEPVSNPAEMALAA